MANFDVMALFLVNNIEEQENAVGNVRNGNKKDLMDPFTMPDQLFIKNFRLTKILVKNLIDLLEPYVVVKSRSSSISLQTKVPE